MFFDTKVRQSILKTDRSVCIFYIKVDEKESLEGTKVEEDSRKIAGRWQEGGRKMG
jgi:hypothetical protein